MEAEGAAGEQTDLGVDRLDPGVGQAVFDGGDDPGALVGDRARELDEGRQATSPRPGDPAVQQRDRGPGCEAVDLAQLLFEQIRAIEPLVGVLDVRELGGLAVGEALGVLPQRKARALELARQLGLPGLAGLVSDLATHLVQRVAG